MQSISSCPVCNGTVFSPFLTCTDHTVSHETFSLHQCKSCGLVITNPRPDDTAMAAYYQSPAYISHSDQSHTIIDHLYKLARNFTLRWKYDLVIKHSPSKPESILDYGCGTGAFLQQCQHRGMTTFGVEPSDSARQQALTKIPNVSSGLDDIQRKFDVITLWHVLEHVSNLNDTLEDLANHLLPNGTMFIAVPNLQSQDAAHYREFWAAYDVPRHLWHFTRTTMQKLLNNHHLTLTHVAPMKLDAYYVSLLSEKYRNKNHSPSSIAKALVNASLSNRQAKKTREYSSLIYIARK